MFHKVIVTTTYIPAYFEEQVRSLQKVNVFLGNRIADDGEPVIQLVRNAWLPDVCLGDNCDSHSCRSVSISLSFYVSGYGPSPKLVRWTFG